MKKLLLTVVTGVALLAGSTCFATVPANQLELGGIPYGASISAVENAYGRPRKSEREMKSYGPDFIHEEDFIYYAEGMQGIGLKIEIKYGKVTEIKCGVLN